MSQLEPTDLAPVAQSICLSQKLKLEHSLGHGSFKQAYLVADSAGERFALKIIRDPNPSARTEREVDCLCRCHHPSLATLLRLDTHSIGGIEYQYLIEEYLSGGTLTSRIESSNISIPFLASSSVRTRGGRNRTTFE